MNKAEVIGQIVETGVIPVIRAGSADEAAEAIEAIRRGGISVMEITMTVPGAVELIEKISKRYGSDVLVGAGTVLNAETARDCITAGAKFIISPALNLETIVFCNRQDVCVMPGALTPTEVVTAWQSGADFVKIFPAGAMGGASYIKSLKAPLPQIKVIPTGGVSLKNSADFIKAGSSAIGIGADLVDLEAIRKGDAHMITERAKEYLQIVENARKS